MALPSPEFLFDFGSPNAYLAHQVIPSVEHRTGAKFRYVPVLLGGVFKATGNRSPAEAFVPVKLAYEGLETRRFVARHGLTRFRANPHFPVNTLSIMRCAVAAGRLGIFEATVEALFAGMWEEAKKLDDPAVIEATLKAASLPAGEILALTQDGAVKAELIGNTESAVARGVFGSPTFFVGEEMFFGKDRLEAVEAEIARPS